MYMDPEIPDDLNLDFKEQLKLFLKVMKKDSYRGLYNRQKHTLQQNNVVAGKKLP